VQPGKRIDTARDKHWHSGKGKKCAPLEHVRESHVHAVGGCANSTSTSREPRARDTPRGDVSCGGA
jgi:hypothetical protein